MTDYSDAKREYDSMVSMENKLKEIEVYCIKHKQYMWAAHIWSIITNKDFKDISNEENKDEF